MFVQPDDDDFGAGLYGDGSDTAVVVDLRGQDAILLTCLGCGEAFVGTFYDNCPVCGTAADEEPS